MLFMNLPMQKQKNCRTDGQRIKTVRRTDFFSDLYDSASFEAKKMIVNQLIRRVDVYRGYQLNITFNFDLTPYIEGDDTAAC